jgi:hypothetical protein
MDVDEPPTTIVAGPTLGVTVDLIFKVASKNQSDATVTFLNVSMKNCGT